MRAVPGKVAVLGIALSGSAAALAETPAWDQAEQVNIELSNFAFSPAALQLHPGQVYRLHFVNKGSATISPREPFSRLPGSTPGTWRSSKREA